MRKLVILLSGFFVSGNLFAQSPNLTLVGNSPSLTKGGINTEVLTAVIQQKQKELENHVFENTIIKVFDKSNYLHDFNNFTTYDYLYKIADNIVSGQNKTTITKNLISCSAQFALIYGVAFYVSQSGDVSYHGDEDIYSINDKMFDNCRTQIANLKRKELRKELKALDKNEKDSLKDKEIAALKNRKTAEVFGIIPIETFDEPEDDTISDVNILLDLCYDIILNSNNLKTMFKFTDPQVNDGDFKTWYNSDNGSKYLLEKRSTTGHDSLALDSLRKVVTQRITNLVNLVGSVETLVKNIKDFSKKDSLNAQNLSGLANSLANLDSNTALIIEGDTRISKPIRDKIAGLADTFNNTNLDYLKNIILFCNGLKKNNYQDFSLTKDQYYAMKSIITDFLKVAKNKFDNDVLSNVIEFLMDNTVIEYTDKSGTPVNSGATSSGDIGYLSINAESVITELANKFSPDSRLSVLTYVRPFFTIGINYLNFPHNNNLNGGNDNGQSLSNLNLASEKLGVEYVFWNNKYRHSHSAGEKYKYYGKYIFNESPQTQPTISNFKLNIYASGLLYNLVNLKSNQSFNYSILGTSIGVTVYNGLQFSVGAGQAITNLKSISYNIDDVFYNFSIDIPIIDYLSALGKSK